MSDSMRDTSRSFVKCSDHGTLWHLKCATCTAAQNAFQPIDWQGRAEAAEAALVDAKADAASWLQQCEDARDQALKAIHEVSELRAALALQAQELDKVKAVLAEIRDRGDCECNHDDENCCAHHRDYYCPSCLAAVALLPSLPSAAAPVIKP